MKQIVFYSIKNINNVFCNLVSEMLKKKIIFINSSMGRGKTKLVSKMISLLGGKKSEVKSPSYNLKNVYKTNYFYIFHYDLHRIRSVEEILSEEKKKVTKESIIIFEWGDNIEINIKEKYLKININLCKNFNIREILIFIK